MTVGEPAPTADLPDGKWFGFVTVDGDNGPTVVTIDIAEILSGEEARKAAVDAGVIEEGEDLPNDFFIYDPDDEIEVLTLADDVVIRVLSASTPETYLTIDASTLESLFNGSYSGEPVSWPISRNGLPGSSSRSTRSLGRSLPRDVWRSLDFSDPPRAACATFARSSSASARLCAARAFAS
jgi:hypothetical protein